MHLSLLKRLPFKSGVKEGFRYSKKRKKERKGTRTEFLKMWSEFPVSETPVALIQNLKRGLHLRIITLSLE